MITASEATRQPARDGELGSALLVTLLVMAITLGLGASMVTVGVTDLEISGNYRSRATAYYAADSGLEQTVVDLRADPSWILAMLDPADWSRRDPFPASVPVNGMTISVTHDAQGNVVTSFYPLGGTRTVSAGSFDRTLQLPPRVDTSAADPVISFTARSVGGGGVGILSTQVVRADIELTVDSYGVWDNAIFAGEGQAGNLINGNVAIRGSVHVVGNPANPPAIAFGGTADIRNNYSDAGSHFGATDAARLPALPIVDVNGVPVETLDTVIRLEHGSIDLSGNADIGAANNDSNGVKETVDAVRADGTVGPTGAVHTDEWGPYDATGVEFPSLDDPYHDAASGMVYSHHRDYLDAVAMTVTVAEISANVGDFAYSDANGNSISWDQSAQLLDINGIVRLDGSLKLGKSSGSPSSRGLYYAGRGTLYATGDIAVDGWTVPQGNYLADGNLGLIAANDVLIEKASQINVMAAIFAERTVSVAKQTNIAGALVSNLFDMGSNVPSIFHVPDLSSNLPPGMPGSEVMGVIKRAAIANWYQETDQ